MTTLFLVRHAHADWTPDESRPLSAQGQRDAEAVAEVLSALPITAIYTSSARRAYDTVAPLAHRLALPITVCDDLRERSLSDAPVDDFVGAVWATWDEQERALPGGESNRSAQRRGLAMVRLIEERHPAAHVAVATHGNLLALILQHFDTSIGFDFWRSLSMPDIYQLTIGSGVDPAIRRRWTPA